MDNTQKSKAEKLQIKLDKLLQIKEKRQQAFEKSKQELSAVSKEVDNVKLKLFEILQSGSDDVKFSDWAKRKINENAIFTKSENANFAKNENSNLAKTENPNSLKPKNSNDESTEEPTTHNRIAFTE